MSRERHDTQDTASRYIRGKKKFGRHSFSRLSRLSRFVSIDVQIVYILTDH